MRFDLSTTLQPILEESPMEEYDRSNHQTPTTVPNASLISTSKLRVASDSKHSGLTPMINNINIESS